MNELNYLHLYQFWIVAQEMNVSRAAQKLRISQSTVSEHIIELEEMLGHALFARVKKRLVLTEAGRLAFDYAETIFKSGNEMLDTFRQKPLEKQKVSIRIGAVGYLSKNLQIEFLSPLINDTDVRIYAVQGELSDLCRRLKNHELDLVLSNAPVSSQDSQTLFSHLIAEVPVFLVGTPSLSSHSVPLAKLTSKHPIFVPPKASSLRSEFDSLLASMNIDFEPKAEVEDMALMRLFALSGSGLALVPEIVVKTELELRRLKKICRVGALTEKFYAITASRKFPNPKVEAMVRTLKRRL